MPCRPTDWACRPHTITPKGGQAVDGWRVTNYGRAPWTVVSPRIRIHLRNARLTRAIVLDMNGMPVDTIRLREGVFDFPADAMYVVLQ
ncbi:MAG: hypothetical protein KAI66_27125 [Lentisphaeria bacterium]|nr:hypothetical protein [Lentisphaeria bacterium]